MKNVFTYLLCLSSFLFSAQGLFINGKDASLRVDTSGFISVDGHFINENCDSVLQVRFNGSLYLSGDFVNNANLKFAGSTNSSSDKATLYLRRTLSFPSGSVAAIGGTVTPKLWSVVLDKPGGSVQLYQDVTCSDTLEFINGNIYLETHNWELIDPIGAASVINHPWIKNENNLSCFLPSGLLETGQIVYKTIFTASADLNPGNIGIELKGALDYGSDVEFYRGFLPHPNLAKSGINSCFRILSPSFALTSNTVFVRYFATDMLYHNPGTFSLSALKLFVSDAGNTQWSPLKSVAQATLVGGSVTEGYIGTTLQQLTHPNVGLDGKNMTLAIADPNCPNPPVSALLNDTIHICTGITATLDAGNNSAIANSSLRWEWETTPPSYQRTLAVSADNLYHRIDVSLIDVRGCITRDSVVIAPEAPYPQITYLNHLNACRDSITIKDSVKISSGSFTNLWSFSDNSTSTTTLTLFKKLFQYTGQHSLELVSTSDLGCSTSATLGNIMLFPKSSANFTFSHDCLTDVVSFTNTSATNNSVNVVAASSWSLGAAPQHTSTAFAPVTTYSSSGNYTVTLAIITSGGCRDTVSHPVVIYPKNIAAIGAANACTGDSIQFNDLSACNTGSCSATWYFGDGTQALLSHPKKTYLTAGAYQVKLKITAPVGCPDSVSRYVFSHHIPQADFYTGATASCVNESVYLTNTSSLASGSIVSCFWNYGNTFTAGTTNGACAYVSPGNYQIGLTVISDSGCVSTKTAMYTALAQPLAQYTVASVCQGQQSLFQNNSVGPGLTYNLYYGDGFFTGPHSANTQNYLYNASGTHASSMIVTDNNGCSDTAFVPAVVLAKPAVNLGGTVKSCGSSYVFNAQNPGCMYHWTPGNQQTQAITVNSGGLFGVLITGTNGCFASDSVMLVLNDAVQPDLGNDTTVCGPFMIDAGYPGSTYLWNNTTGTQMLKADTSGVYTVHVTDMNQCSGSDTIVLNVKTAAVVYLGTDTLLCRPDSGLLLKPVHNVVSYTWGTGEKDKPIAVMNSGFYHVYGLAANGCEDRDTVLVHFRTTPVAELGGDATACGGILLDARNNGCEYKWNDGSNEKWFEARKTGMVSVQVTDPSSGCIDADTIEVTIHPLPEINLGNDTSFCSNAALVLDAGNPAAAFSWLNGAQTRTLGVKEPGLHGVTVTSTAGCVSSDYIVVSIRQTPVTELGASARFLCGTAPLLLLSPQTTGNIWYADGKEISKQKSISVTSEGKYWLTTHNNACEASDTVSVFISSNTVQAMFLASTLDTVNRPVKFVNLSEPGPLYQTWYFGDGHVSTETSPVHTYLLPTDFSVTLEVSNGYCSDRITKALSVLFRKREAEPLAVAPQLELVKAVLYPNPGSGRFFLDLRFNRATQVRVNIADISGRLLVSYNLEEEKDHLKQVDIPGLPPGLYFIRLQANGIRGELTRSLKFIKAD